MAFEDRRDAGRQLAGRLQHLTGVPAVVLGLPRGGVPVAAEVAAALGVPLDVIVVRKLGVPSRPELAFGALGEDGVRVVNDEVVRSAGLSSEQVAGVEDREQTELERRASLLRVARPRADIRSRTAIVVDDGIATGATARAACSVARTQGASRVVLAVPVGPAGWARSMGDVADERVSVEAPRRFGAVGYHYVDFTPVSDDDVVDILEQARRP